MAIKCTTLQKSDVVNFGVHLSDFFPKFVGKWGWEFAVATVFRMWTESVFPIPYDVLDISTGRIEFWLMCGWICGILVMNEFKFRKRLLI